MVFDVELGTRRNDDETGAHFSGFTDIGSRLDAICFRLVTGSDGAGRVGKKGRDGY